MQDLIVLLCSLLCGARVTSLEVFRIKAFAQKNDLLAAGHGAKNFRQCSERIDFAIDALAHRGFIHVLHASGRLDLLLGCNCRIPIARSRAFLDRLERFGLIGDLKRIGSLKRSRIADRRGDQRAVGGECGEKAESAIGLDRADSDQIARQHGVGDELPGRLLRPRQRVWRCVAEIEQQHELAPCVRI